MDRTIFDESIQLIALRIAPRQCATFTKRLHGHMFHRPKVRPIVADDEGPTADCSNNDSVATNDGCAGSADVSASGNCGGGGASASQSRLLLLDERVTGLELAELPDELRAFVAAEAAVPVRYTLRLGYEHLSAEQALRRLLPEGVDVPSAFESVGHVAHVNLRAEALPFKALIGQVLLEKNAPRIRTVVNKVESISNEFRVFPMEVLAGDESLVTTVRENGCRFDLDFRDVYWNSRLETEHKRVVQLLPKGAVVADAFAGIGPFAVPAAKRGCLVYANDLNPRSHEFLCANVALNHVARNVRTYNLDGRAFVRELLRGDAEAGAAEQLPFGYFSHVLMNLPASALTFLDAFVGAFRRDAWKGPLPMVHCYCFSKAADPAADVIAIAERIMGCTLPDASVHVVRDVSPHKLMLCLEFRVPDSVAWKQNDEPGTRMERSTDEVQPQVPSGRTDSPDEEERTKRPRTAS